ncbi:hypothetical protein EUBVEN_00714 [Eubacterium ventriosum ATCC 27560]|uniref:Uncharacterized protein n=1 Tax=Eubacterium ventriosum ATCC 27560 TaxID=411463 RepID=A5Z4T8_9FIRM|nr:hypothetical protein EUBVEN_00714 [Eubacterium ventriosum ATCC 27560]
MFLHDFILLSRPSILTLASGALRVFLFLLYFLSVCYQLCPDTMWLQLWLFSGFLFPLCDCLLILTILKLCSFKVFQKFLYTSVADFLYNLWKIIFHIPDLACQIVDFFLQFFFLSSFKPAFNFRQFFFLGRTLFLFLINCIVLLFQFIVNLIESRIF